MPVAAHARPDVYAKHVTAGLGGDGGGGGAARSGAGS
jgi:hypothetical protein